MPGDTALTRRSLTAALIAALPALLGAAVIAPPPAQPVPTLPYVQWIGQESKAPPGFSLILDDSAWGIYWAAHTGVASKHTAPARHAAPKIDFTQCMVVAYNRPPTANADGEALTSILLSKDLLRLRFEQSTFQTASLPNQGNAAPGAIETHPFGIWVLPRTNTPIVIEEGRRQLKDAPLTWTEVHRFTGR